MHKLKNIPVDLSRIRDIKDNDDVKRECMGKLVTKFNYIDVPSTTGLVSSTK